MGDDAMGDDFEDSDDEGKCLIFRVTYIVSASWLFDYKGCFWKLQIGSDLFFQLGHYISDSIM